MIVPRSYPDTKSSPPINDGFWMRLLTIFLAEVCDRQWHRRWKKSNMGVMYISSKLCLRCCPRIRLNEARAMHLVREHTSIPVPKVYCSFIHNDLVHILMERLPGKPLSHGWVFRSDASKAKILAQLRPMIAELRTVPRPPPPPGSPPNTNVVSGVDGGQFFDGNLPDMWYCGPFSSVRDFHRDLRRNLMTVPDELTDERANEMRKLISLHENYEAGAPVLTHGDLSASNILADGDTVTGIVDWETAAWMPTFWEYTNAWHVNPYNPYWQMEVGKFIDEWPAELEMEKLRRKFFKAY